MYALFGYTKAFDRVRHEEIITILQQLNIDGKDLRIIKKHLLGTESSSKSLRRDEQLPKYQTRSETGMCPIPRPFLPV